MAKKATYNPAPIDADGDGLVQDGTEFERPVEETLEPIEETVEEAVEAPVEVPAINPAELVHEAVYVAKDGDTYASIAARLNPGEVSNYNYAKALFDLNKGKTLREGTEVSL